MALPPRKPSLSPEEYLRIERAAQARSEYCRREMFAMAGSSPNHSLISVNLIGELGNNLKGKPVAVYTSNLRIHVDSTGLYTYPDAIVVCGELEFDDDRRDTVVNPTVIVEVLSDSTEAYDRGKKFNQYRQLPSLRDYLLVSQNDPIVERFSRNSEGEWTLTDARGMENNIALPSIGVELPLAEIFAKVVFPPETPPPAECKMETILR